MAVDNPFKGITPRTSFGLSGLGAVGGPTGVAAGSLRVLVEFITQYDGARLKELTAQLETVQLNQQKQQQETIALQQQSLAIDKRIEEAQKAKRTALTSEQKQLRQIVNTQAAIDKAIQQHNARSGLRAQLEKQILALARSSKSLTVDQIRDIAQLAALDQQRAALHDRIRGSLEQENVLEESRNAIVEEGTAIQKIRDQVAPKIGALFTGALGGLVGGVLLGALFTPIQDAIEKNIVEPIKDIIDPARHAREALGDIAKEVRSIADAGGTDLFGAAKFELESLGHLAKSLNLDENLLVEAAKLQQQNDLLEKTNKLLELRAHFEQLQGETAVKYFEQYIATQKELHPELQKTIDQQRILDGFSTFTKSDLMTLGEAAARGDEFARAILLAAQSAYQLDTNLNEAAKSGEQLAQEAKEMRDAFNDIHLENLQNQIRSAGDAIADAISKTGEHSKQLVEDKYGHLILGLDHLTDAQLQDVDDRAQARIRAIQEQMSALEVIPSRRTNRLQAQLDALKDAGPSKRTIELTKALQRLNDQEARRAYLENLAKNAEQIHLLVLQHRLEIGKKQIDIDRYSGKERITAIDASIARLQKQGEEQARLNKLLDAQYERSQVIRREEGETIHDFLLRRAQEQRHQLAEAEDAQRDARIKQLEDTKDATQYLIDLEELRAQRVNIIHQHEIQQYEKRLQARLQASQEADRKALEAARDSLQKRLDASKKADQDALESRRRALQDEITAVRNKADAEEQRIKEAADAQKQIWEKEKQDRLDQIEAETAAKLKAESETVDKILKYADFQEVSRYKIAYQGARNLQELQDVAGGIAGSNFAYSQLLSEVQGLGLSDSQTAEVLGNIRQLRMMYLSRLGDLGLAPKLPSFVVPHYAKGGVFPLRNSMNFGDNIIAGEQGTELGVILSNQVVKAINNGDGKLPPMNFHIQSTEDPRQAEYRLRRMIKEVIREAL